MEKMLNTKYILAAVIGLCSVAIFALASADSNAQTKAGQLTIADPFKNHSFRMAAVSNGSTLNEVVSPVINTDFPFNAVSFTWNQADGANFEMYVRFQKESWTDWQKVQEDLDVMEQADKSTGKRVSSLVFAPYTNILEYKLITSNGNTNYISNLVINYVDTTNSKSSYQAAAVSSQEMPIVSRAQWGADESYRYDENGQEAWAREYYTPKRFVIHHTDSSSLTDPAASVRAIYYFHAKQQDWGDVGYNYFIDGNGVIYEGRAGGDGVTGAHAYMNNRGSIGIAILGCYHDQKACNTPDHLTDATAKALREFIAYKSRQFNIDPAGQAQTFDHGTMSTVLGHKDIGRTNCPGDNIYEKLGLVRNQSSVQLASLAPLQKFAAKAQLISPSSIKAEVPSNSTKQVEIKIKNIGQSTWHGYEDDHLLLSTEAKKLGLIDGYKFAASSTTNVTGFKLADGNVGPGETGTFVMNLPPQAGTKTYTLAWNGKGYFAGTDVTITTTIGAPVNQSGNTPAPVFVPVYKATLLTFTIPEMIAVATSQQAEITFLNQGNVAWEKSQLVLSLPLETGIKSPIFNSLDYLPAEDKIEPGQVATFKINLAGGKNYESMWHIVKLAYNKQELLSFNQRITVVPPLAAQIVLMDFPAKMKRNSKSTVTLTLKNIGSMDWNTLALKSTSDRGMISEMHDPSWAASKVISNLKKTVKPGEEVTFTMKFWAPNKSKVSTSLYKLWTGKQAIVINGEELLKKQIEVTK